METPQQPAVPGPPVPADGPPSPPGRVVPRQRRLRLVLAMVAGIVTLLCLGGVGVFVAVYDNATEIKRSSPDAVVDSFLRAYLVDRDDDRAALYMCKSGGDFDKLKAFRRDIQSREQQYTIAVRLSWGSLSTVGANGQMMVSTDIHRAISDGSEGTSDRWQFSLVEEDGWRVCGATKVS